MFQSSPGPKTGCYAGTHRVMCGDSTFQSSPGPKTGCYVVMREAELAGELVSILTRSEDRVLPRG